MDAFIQSPGDENDDLNDPIKVQNIVQKIRHLKKETVSYAPDAPIINEGESNAFIYVILEGSVQLLKHGQTKASMPVDRFGPGDLLGLTSFWSQQPSFLSSKAITAVNCLRLRNEDVEQLVHEDPAFGKTVHRIFISNLSKRYRRMIALNIKVAELGNALEHEHAQLKQAMQDLESTRNQLVHQEKLATLGQLLAGIAHEINNPCAALNRGVDNLIRILPTLFDTTHVFGKFNQEGRMLTAGMNCPYWSAEEKRSRMHQLLEQYPNIKRPLARRMAQLDEHTFRSLHLPDHGSLADKTIARISNLFDFYEIGNYLRSVQLSSDRIHKLVISLKNYGKHDEATWQMFDLRDGIRDTLTVLNNRLKHYRIQLRLDPIPPIYGSGSELNQVWTNLLINAIQATESGKTIAISTEQTDPHSIMIQFSDAGTGIQPHLLEKIFEANFTTKKSKSDFGLGLGLAISKEIIEKHGGNIQASNRAEGGACFTITLPVRSSQQSVQEHS